MAFTSPRFLTGCAILFLVDILWTASSELTEHLYKQKHYNKPFFTAYIKSMMFTVYLFGFIFCDSWWSNSSQSSEYYSSIAENDQQNLTIDDDDDDDDDDGEDVVNDEDDEERNSSSEDKDQNDGVTKQKKTKGVDEEFDDDENESIEKSINANTEEFEEINLNQPNVIVKCFNNDIPETPERQTKSLSKCSSSRETFSNRSPYIGEATWVPISACSDTSSISGKSDEEEQHSDGENNEDESSVSHLNETDDDKLLLMRTVLLNEPNRSTDSVDSILAASGTINLASKSAFASTNKPGKNLKKRKRKRSVRFSKLMEVRHMTAKHAEDAFLSRLSYSAFMRHIYQKTHQSSSISRSGSRNGIANTFYRTPSLNIKETALLSFYFTSIWFTANLSFHFGLQYSEAGLVNVLSSTTPLFTLLLGLIFPSGVSNDSISVTKLLAVALFISSVAVISTTEPIEPSNIVNTSISSSFNIRQVSVASPSQTSTFPVGSLWTLCGAFFYAVYIVLMRYNVLHDSMLNFPMFFGFIGLFSLILMWPFILLLDFTQLEIFEWPNNEQWFYLLVNGLCGTVISELLFLLGSFLTSSLVGTIAVSFTIPLAVFFDIFFKDITYPRIFFLGTIPMMFSFFVIILVSQYADWDPIMVCIRKFMNYVHTLPHHSGTSTARYRNMDNETSVLQNLGLNHDQIITHSNNDLAIQNTSNNLDDPEIKSSSSSTTSNCNRRFERYSNKEDEPDDGEQTQALINDQDNNL